MFANLSSFWKGQAFLTKVLEEFKTMLDNTEQTYSLVIARLLENAGPPDVEEQVWQIDKGVNEAQRDIRRHIVEHLSLQPTVDINACLLLMSVVKDAERIGDYAKNLYEVTRLLENPVDMQVFRRYLGEMDKEILTLFSLTREAFVESDEDKSELAWGYEERMKKRCDTAVAELAHSELPVNEAVCLTLVARHFKRIIAHLTNIATSVVLPLSDIDYFDERRRLSRS